MPPKRKRTDENTETTTRRSTRMSTRSKGKSTQIETETETPASGSVVSNASDTETPPQKKKTRKAQASASTSRNGRGKKAGQAELRLDDDAQNDKTKSSDKPVGQSSKAATPKLQPYSQERATELFSRYVDEESRDVIGPEGFEKLCNDANIAMDGAAPLLLAWQFGTAEMAKITKSEWQKGTDELWISSTEVLAVTLRELEDLIVHAKRVAHSKSATEPYNRARYRKYSHDLKKAYNELYMFCFVLAKPETSRSMDIETACALWSVLVTPKYPVMKDILEFIVEKGTYKGVNKDLWTMTLEFCQLVSPNLEGYDSDGAWPTMLDEFVNWKRPRLGEA
ncbi:hypothetical protein QCA50_007742 [Cerrena zonata]|uniref:Defective in cullin neddylation protein n=1 Tax=Cerrena zonata TaxID=2478898 RepID=A0AAW0G8J3_9APHY